MSKRSVPSKLNVKQVENAKPKDKPYKLSDGGGLYLLVNPNGSRYWRLKYRIDKKEKTLALGVYKGVKLGVSLEKARKLANEAKEQITEGNDPGHIKKLAKHKGTGNDFALISREWWEKESGKWTPDHARKVWKSIETEAIPVIGALSMDSITSRDCLMVIRNIEERGALDVASRVKQRMSAIFRYGVYTGRNENNPVDALKDVIQSRRVVHRKALATKELPHFLQALESAENLTAITKLGIQFLVLTFVRPGELRQAEWIEIDQEAREWRIPANKMKMREEHIVPLSTQAIELLQALKLLIGKSPYLFPGYHNFRKPMSENTLTFAIRKRLGFDATAHGFRTVASTILNESGFRPDLIERQLAHAERNKVRAAYNKAQYLAERREMMQWWADYIEESKNTGKVVPIFSNQN